ncbi:MAG: glycine cleavage system protein H [Candidatus Bathyarchaeota archaeon]|nr:MAG: glycine cleavage system protein H [Candidatus Bathyarchaeota archaeon]
MSSEFLETTIDKFMLRVKRGLRYSEDHIWIQKENQHCSLGLTDYAQRRSGDLVFIEFPVSGGRVKAGDPVALYETIKAALEAKAPFDCGVEELNRVLEGRPELINEEPYGAGWIARVKPVDPESVDSLLSPEQYFELMKEEATQS